MEDDWCVIGLHPDIGLARGQSMHSGPGFHISGISISSLVVLSVKHENIKLLSKLKKNAKFDSNSSIGEQ